MAIIPGTEFGRRRHRGRDRGRTCGGCRHERARVRGDRVSGRLVRHCYAAFYLRPTNGRAIDQLRRNHSTQYISHPDYPWFRLRKEQPGVFESYVDLEAGAWTPIRIEVRGGVARLFVHGSPQPVLIVNDMKSPPASGRIALWIDAGTEAYFSRLRVTPAR
jgi:hypothetical protein